MLYSFLYYLKIYLIPHDCLQSFQQISPQNNPHSIHQQVNTSLKPHFLIFMIEFIIFLEIALKHSIGNRKILIIILPFTLIHGFKHLPKQHFTRNQISQNESLLRLRQEADFRKAFFCFFKILIDQRILPFLEQKIIQVPRSKITIDLRGIYNPLYLLVIMKRKKNGYLHDIDKRQKLSLYLIANSPRRFISLKCIQQSILKFGSSRTVIYLFLRTQKDSLCCSHYRS